MFWYIATPYSKFPAGIVAAYEEACRQTAVLVRAGVPSFSPIAHTHGIAKHGGIDPFAHDIWLPADAALMEAACGIIVVKMIGWDTSFGVAHEIEYFRSIGRAVIYMEPGVVPAELLEG